MNTFKTSIAVGGAALVASLAVGFGPAEAAKPTPAPTTTTTPAPVVQAPCSIVSKVITLGHDRWMVKARLYRDGKRYPRHAVALTVTAPDGVTTLAESVKFGKKAKWNWRITGLIAPGVTLQATYAGDDKTLSCAGAVLTPVPRPEPTTAPTTTAPAA